MPRLRPYYDINPNDWWLVSNAAEASDDFAQKIYSQNISRELVRQWVLREIVDSYQYPREWVGTRIIAVDPESTNSYKVNIFGFCILTVKGEPFLWCSVGAPGEAEQAEKSLKNALMSGLAGLGICTDGSAPGSKFIRRRFNEDKCEYILELELYSPPKLVNRLQQSLFPESVFSASISLKPLSDRIEDIFFEAHSHIRDIDGMHADEALDELCKVLYAKFYDEERTGAQRNYFLQRWLYGSTEEVATLTRMLYEEANAYDLRVFSLKIPGYQRSRGVFDAPIRLSSPALAKVVETFQDYDLTHSAADVKGRAFQKVIGPSIRAGMGQYFTPYSIVHFMAKVAGPHISDLILDPFCGSGHFLTACLQLVRQEVEQSRTGDKSWYEFAFGKLHGIEKSDRMVRIAMTDMRLHGDGHSNIRCTDALLAFTNYPDLHPESFDLILTNPPFGSLLGTTAIAQLGLFSLAEGRSNLPLEVLGAERCIQFLRPGGRLGIVLPDGLLDNRASTNIRDWLEGHVRLYAIVSLPVETFALYGANVKTSIVFARKWRQEEQRDQDYPVFLARVDNVGYDSTGRLRDLSELDLVADDLISFFKEEAW